MFEDIPRRAPTPKERRLGHFKEKAAEPTRRLGRKTGLPLNPNLMGRLVANPNQGQADVGMFLPDFGPGFAMNWGHF
jgi:hypothetical protein